MKKNILIYVISCVFGCVQAQKQESNQHDSIETTKPQQRLMKIVSHPVPKQGFSTLADSMFTLCSQVYYKVPKNMNGYCYLDIHLFVGENGELADIKFYYSKLFGDYFENQNARISLMLKYWQPAVNKESQKTVSYSVNILSKVYKNKYEIVFFNIQNDTLALFTRSR